jgi:hypothetical protein
VIVYRAMLDVPRELAQYVSRLLHAERRRRGTRKNSRALTCFRQAVLGLRWFRQNAEVTALARDHGVSRATGYRYLMQQWNIRVSGAPRKEIDTALLIQAVIALGKQLQREESHISPEIAKSRKEDE